MADSHFNFRVRDVRPGTCADKGLEVLAGLVPGEVVASRGSATLRAELLKNDFGAG